MRLLYIDIDSLRADHLGCYGYPLPTTPNIDELAEECVQFSNVYSSDVPSLPSRTAVSTAMFGIRNGVVSHGGLGAELRPIGHDRGVRSPIADQSFPATLLREGIRTVSISSFPLRYSAPWWNNGFAETVNHMGSPLPERAHDTIPHALDWLGRNGIRDDWMMYICLQDPNRLSDRFSAPNLFKSSELPEWYTEEIRQLHWQLPGPSSAQEVGGFFPDMVHPSHLRTRDSELAPVQIRSMEDAKRVFDNYDMAVRYADDAVGQLINGLQDLGIYEDTAIVLTSGHGQALGELGVYAGHQAADEVTCKVPMLLRWPGVEPSINDGLHYQFDVITTLVDLAGIEIPRHWDGESIRYDLESMADGGRNHLVLSQGAWSCQRSVRWSDLLYIHTFHDGFHWWPDEMLFNVVDDPHEQKDLAPFEPSLIRQGRALLDDWTFFNMDLSLSPIDPMEIVLAEGGPFQGRVNLPSYLKRLKETGRAHWADELAKRHPTELIEREQMAD